MGSNPVTCTNKKSTALAVVPFLFIRVVGFEVGRKLRQQFVREGVALAGTKQSGGLFVGKAATGGNPVIRTKKVVSF